MSYKRLIDGTALLEWIKEEGRNDDNRLKGFRAVFHEIQSDRFDLPQSMYEEECDWCGGDTLCHSVSKPDGMPGDICLSCLIAGKHLPNQGEAARLREALNWTLGALTSVTSGEPVRNLDEVISFAIKALSSPTEGTGIQKVRELYEIACEEENVGYQNGIKAAIKNLGITIPGITDGGEGE